MAKLGVCLLLFLTTCCLSVVKANFLSLGEIITYKDSKVKTIFAAYEHFNGYGCYCGLGGKGEPVDAIDRCCQQHDKCYDDLVANNECDATSEIATVYHFKKYRHAGKPQIDCSTSAEGCPRDLCRCDAEVAECFARNEAHYNKEKYAKYDRNTKCGD